MNNIAIRILYRKLWLKLRGIIRIPKNSYLCLKYPFLYPGNRFDGKHHSYTLNNLYYKLDLKANRKIGINIQCIKQDEIIPTSKLDSFVPGLFVDFKDYLMTVRYRNEIKKVSLSGQLRNKFNIRGFRIRKPMYASGVYSIHIFVSKIEEDNNNYGFCYQRISFIESKFLYKLSNIVRWIDHNILDKIFFLPTYTELDSMDEGWRKAFGLQMCEEIKQSLLKTGGKEALKNYRIMQVKEKFGELRWYDEYSTKEVHSIITKYENISRHTCVTCGKPAKYLSRGWICPYCEEHIGDEDRVDIIYDEKE